MPDKNKKGKAKQHEKRFQVSLRFTILFIFVALYLATSALIVAIRSVAFNEEMAYTSHAMMHHASDAVFEELDRGIKPIEVQAQFTASLIQHKVVSQNQTELIPYLFYIVNTMPLVRSAFWGDESGNFIVARKEDNETVTSEIVWNKGKKEHIVQYHDATGAVISSKTQDTQNFDPRTREWYKRAAEAGKLVWTDIYNYSHAQKGITLAVPIYTVDGKLQSVLGFIVSLEYLNRFIADQKIAKHGYSFIIAENENLIAYPDRGLFASLSSKNDQLINVHQQQLPVIDESLDQYEKNPKNEMTIKYAGENYLVTYMPVLNLADKEWLIGVIVPESDFTGFLKRINYLSLLVGLSVLFMGVILFSGLVTRIVKPIKTLVNETKKIKAFELDGDINIDSRIKEVNHLKASLSSMKRGLKHFQKYVPKSLVQQLIESGQDMQVGGVKRNLVVMFSDIENFTKIAEKVDPQQLMVQVCEYFEAMTNVITGEKGTIDKYIGDAVMAFWGAPLVESKPCEHAARAALECQKRLADLNNAWKARGWPMFVTRIGIHRGDAIVGNVGSSERLNYTALGDTINITSRLEGINKDYNTKVIVSEVVYNEIKDKFILREVDSVMLKGITHPMTVYELLGDSMQDINFDIDAYRYEFELGLQTFHKDQFDHALDHFSKCLKIYPDDYLVPKFIQQCQEALQR